MADIETQASINKTVKNLTSHYYPPFYHPPDDSPALPFEGDIDYPFEDVSAKMEDENKIRVSGNWSTHVEFVVSAIGFTVGISKLWRFPYLMYHNGGLVFLLAYIAMLLLIGLPLLYLEMAISQFASLGMTGIWKACPIFRGIGFAMLITASCITVYSQMTAAWAVFYAVQSLAGGYSIAVVPWSICDHAWASPDCHVWDRSRADSCTADLGLLLKNGSCLQPNEVESVLEDLRESRLNSTNVSTNMPLLAVTLPQAEEEARKRSMPGEEYFHNYVLELSNSILDVGTIRWQIALCLLFCWVVVFICLFKTVKSSGKVVPFTVIAPFVILIILLVRALILDGAATGLLELVTFRYRSLLEYKTYGFAALEAFQSLGICFGALHTLASYNRFHQDIYRASWIILVVDAASNISFAILCFAVLGTLANQMDVSVDQLVKTGPWLVFVTLPDAFSRLPVAPLWSVLYFVMVFCLVLDSQFAMLETIVTTICDLFAERLRKNHRHVLALLSFGFYVLSVPFCTQAGMYFFELLDYFLTRWTLLLLCFFEVMAFAWVYGIDNVLDNFKWMMDYYAPPFMYWKLLYKFALPLLLLTLIMFTWLELPDLPYSGTVSDWPSFLPFVLWGLSLAPLLFIPLGAIVDVAFFEYGSLGQRIRDSMLPHDEWGPALAIHRSEQYPLQIPEARSPLDHVRQTVAYTRALYGHPTAIATPPQKRQYRKVTEDDYADQHSHDITRRLLPEIERPVYLKQSDFDKETAI